MAPTPPRPATSFTATPPDQPLALYVHWPWCLAKCPYCDFNSRALKPTRADQDQYRDAILRELEYYAQPTQTRRQPLSSVFFGGGTPSLIEAETIAAILAAAKAHWGFQSDCEITLEANPTSIEAARFRAFRDGGINRVSVGVQSLNDEYLQYLGREHSVDEALHALDIASAIFDRYTFDLIYALPGQGQGDWADQLERALELANGHISLYQLTIEPGTAFFRQHVPEADPDLAADLYQLTQELCQDAAMMAYEVSNHARPGMESRHNLTYWSGGDYIGVGPGAHGRLTTADPGHRRPVTRATHQIADPLRWLNAINTQGHGTAKVRELSRVERREELVLSGLRLMDGIDSARFARQSGQPLSAALNPAAILELQDAGLIVFDQQGLRATARGRPVLNSLITRLLDEPDPGTTLT